ncbi:MAG: GNAT family N-acyltransferase [Pseudomonadota bacterium]
MYEQLDPYLEGMFANGSDMNVHIRPNVHALLGQLGTMDVRLAANKDEIRAAQRLRHDVFYEELNAVPDSETRQSGFDADRFDEICDHLIVIDRDAPNVCERGQIVATYRLLRQDVAEAHEGFYSATEFDIAPMLAAHPDKKFLELGRSCVLAPYRNKRTMELLWQGTWAYILLHKMDVLFGCASLSGTDQKELQPQLSFLHNHALAEDVWAVEPLPELAAPFECLPAQAVNIRVAMRNLPPLIKGYLRLGATVSSGAVIDHQFGTTDVLIVMPVDQINPSYVNYYGADASRHAAR